MELQIQDSWTCINFVRLISDRDLKAGEVVSVWAIDVETKEVLENIAFKPDKNVLDKDLWPPAFAQEINAKSRYLAAGTKGDNSRLSTDMQEQGIPLWSKEGPHVRVFMDIPLVKNWERCPGILDKISAGEESDDGTGYRLLVTAQNAEKTVRETLSFKLPRDSKCRESWRELLCDHVNARSGYIRGGVGAPGIHQVAGQYDLWKPLNSRCDVMLEKCTPAQSAGFDILGEDGAPAGLPAVAEAEPAGTGEASEESPDKKAEEISSPVLNVRDDREQLPSRILSDRNVREGEAVLAVAFDTATGAILQQTALPAEGGRVTPWPVALADAVNAEAFARGSTALIVAGTPDEKGGLSTALVENGIPLWRTGGQDTGAFTTSPAADNWQDAGPLPDAGDLQDGETLQVLVCRPAGSAGGDGYLYESLSVALPEGFRTQHHWPFWLSHYINSHCRFLRAGEKRAADAERAEDDAAFPSPRYSALLNRLWVPAHSGLAVSVSVLDGDEQAVSLMPTRPGLAERVEALFTDTERTALHAGLTRVALTDALWSELATVTLPPEQKASLWSAYHAAHRLLIMSTIENVDVDAENRVTVTFSRNEDRHFSEYDYYLMHEEPHPATVVARLNRGVATDSTLDGHVWSVQAAARHTDTFRIEVRFPRQGILRTYIAWPLSYPPGLCFNAVNLPAAADAFTFRSLRERLAGLFSDGAHAQLRETVTQPVLDLLTHEIAAVTDEAERRAGEALLEQAQFCLLRGLIITPVAVDDMNVVHVTFSPRGKAALPCEHFVLRVNKETPPRAELNKGEATGSVLTEDRVWMTPVAAGPEDYFSIEVRRGGKDWTVYAPANSGLDLEQRIRALFSRTDLSELDPAATQKQVDELEEELAARTALGQGRLFELTAMLDAAQMLLLKATLQTDAEGQPDVSVTGESIIRIAFSRLPDRDYTQYVYQLTLKRKDYDVQVAVMDSGVAGAPFTEEEGVWRGPADAGMLGDRFALTAVRTVRGKEKRYELYVSAADAFYASAVLKTEKKLRALFRDPERRGVLADGVDRQLMSRLEREVAGLRLKPEDDVRLNGLLEEAQRMLQQYEAARDSMENMLKALFRDSDTRTALADDVTQDKVSMLEGELERLNLKPKDAATLNELLNEAQELIRQYEARVKLMDEKLGKFFADSKRTTMEKNLPQTALDDYVRELCNQGLTNEKRLTVPLKTLQTMLLKETVDISRISFTREKDDIGQISISFTENQHRDFKDYHYQIFFKSKEYNELKIAEIHNREAFFINPEPRKVTFGREFKEGRYIHPGYKHSLEIRVKREFLGVNVTYILYTSDEV